MHSLIHLNKQILNAAIIKKQFEGRDHIVAPVILMVEGVHHGSSGPLFYPAKELKASAQFWNGLDLPVYHPEKDGSYVTANTPEMVESRSIGRLFNVQFEAEPKPRLKGEIYVDVAKAQKVSPVTLEAITNGLPLEVSTGLFSTDIQTPGTWNDEPYDAIVTDIRPDHLALLPGQTGACSWADGCGIRANEGGGNPNHDPDGKFGSGSASKEDGTGKATSDASGWNGNDTLGKSKMIGGKDVINTQWQEHWDGKTPEAKGSEKIALEHYGAGGFTKMNEGLRSDKIPSSEKKHIENMDSYIKSSPKLGENVTTFRAGVLPQGLKAGDTFTDKAYVSVTGNHSVTSVFANSSGRDDIVQMRVKVPGQAKAVVMSSALKVHDHESEMVLPRGSKFKYSGVTTEKFKSKDGMGRTVTRTVQFHNLEVVI